MIDITTLDLLKYMGQRPPMYIGEYDIFSLKAFLNSLAFQRKSEDEVRRGTAAFYLTDRHFIALIIPSRT